MTNVTVLGAGAWGTAFGQVLADAGNNVTMWAIEPEIVEGIRDHHHNGVRLPSVKVLPSNMTATGDRAEAVANADIVIVAIAAQFARVALVEFKDLIPETALVASLTNAPPASAWMKSLWKRSTCRPTASPRFPDRT